MLNLNICKACGPDLINPCLLKAGAPVLKTQLCRLFNLSLSEAIFPTDWKKENVTPVYKNGNANEVKKLQADFIVKYHFKVHGTMRL